ncbi:uncharacterized protein LOC127839760 [Dreissena polymorpha]|uniref:uncharacterized protein LOC127839760 n=1 Tax=Dreissena polymorpha TaxID=45954 RepID=UPI00226403AE|nr:uncharacterized protein LOC127839760 [Dreissena polymorpha]
MTKTESLHSPVDRSNRPKSIMHKLEFLALKWAINEKFHDYLYGATFEVVTDNNPLTYVTTTAKLDATGQRWIAALANYNFTTRYRPGKNNADADGLSRLIIDPPTFQALSTSTAATVEALPVIVSTVIPDSISEVETQAGVQVPDEVLLSYALSSKDWIEAQSKDPVISVVIDHVHKGTRPSASRALGTSAVDKYRRDWDKLELRNGVLYRKGTLFGEQYHQLVLPSALRDEVFQALHDDLGHQGRDRTMSLFKQRFYWPGIDTFVRDKVASCPRCIRRKAAPDSASLVPIFTSAPMDMICVDYLSLERSKGGFEHILVVTDHFTRYAQAYPTTNQTAKTTARVLFEKFIVNYGFPERIHSDKGAKFMSSLMTELCRLGVVNQSRTTPYHAMGNGMVERFNQILLKMLGTLDKDKKSNWKDHVGPMVHAYNATIHDSTGYSPYYLKFGRHPRLAIDILLGLDIDDLNARCSNEYARKLRERLAHAYKTAKEIAKRTAEVNKRQYDRKAHAAKIKPGDLVLVRNVTLRGKKKIADKWENYLYVVLDQPNPEIPVYDVKRNDPRARRVRRLHRNLILPLRQTDGKPSDIVLEDVATAGTKYVIPQKRGKYTPSDDDVNPEVRLGRPGTAALQSGKIVANSRCNNVRMIDRRNLFDKTLRFSTEGDPDSQMHEHERSSYGSDIDAYAYGPPNQKPANNTKPDRSKPEPVSQPPVETDKFTLQNNTQTAKATDNQTATNITNYGGPTKQAHSQIQINTAQSAEQGHVIPAKSILQEQVIPPSPKVQEQVMPTKPMERKHVFPPKPMVEEQVVPPTPTVKEQVMPPIHKIQEQYMSPKPTVQGQAMPPKPTVQEQGMHQKPTVQEQAMPPKPTIQEQAMPPNPSIQKQAMPPKPSEQEQYMQPQPTVQEHAFPPKPTVQAQIIPPKPTVQEQAIPTKPTVHEHGMQPKPTVQGQSMPPKPTVQEQGMQPTPMVKEQIMPPTPLIREQVMPPIHREREQAMPSKPTVQEQCMQPKLTVKEQIMSPTLTVNEQVMSPIHGVREQAMPPKHTPHEHVRTSKPGEHEGVTTTKSTAIEERTPSKTMVQTHAIPTKSTELWQDTPQMSTVHEQFIKAKSTIQEKVLPTKSTIQEQSLPTQATALNKDISPQSTAQAHVIPAKSTVQYIPTTSKVINQDKTAESTVLGQDIPATSTVLDQDSLAKPILLAQDKSAKSSTPEQGDGFLTITSVLQEQGLPARATVQGRSPKPTDISSSVGLGYQAESQGSITPPKFTAQGLNLDAKTLDKHTTEIDESATHSTDEQQQEFIRKSLETMIELCRCNGESYMARIEEVKQMMKGDNNEQNGQEKKDYFCKLVDTMHEICQSNQRFYTGQLADVKRMMTENDTHNQQKIKKFICKSVETMTEICRTNGENYMAQIEGVKRIMKENEIKQNEQNIKLQRDKGKIQIRDKINCVLQRRIRNLQTMKDNFLLKFGQHGTTGDLKSLQGLLEKDEQLQRRQAELEDTLSVECSTKQTMTDQDSVTTNRGSSGKKSMSIREAVKAKILELCKKKEDTACANEKCLVKELDEVEEQLRKKTDEVDKLKTQIG